MSVFLVSTLVCTTKILPQSSVLNTSGAITVLTSKFGEQNVLREALSVTSLSGASEKQLTLTKTLKISRLAKKICEKGYV